MGPKGKKQSRKRNYKRNLADFWDPIFFWKKKSAAGATKKLKNHRNILTNWIKATGDQGQVVESDIGLLATMKRWGDLCVNPEYDKVRERYKEWKQSQIKK